MYFEGKEIVVFDVETTGLSPARGDRIVEIAAIKIRNLVPVDRFHSLVNPQRSISLEAFEVNRISPEMLLEAPTARQVLPDFLNFLGQATLVGHNIHFDLSFLYNELDLLGITGKKDLKFFDTMHLARKILPQLSRYSLWSIARFLAIGKSQKHRAMDDAQMTFEVFERLVKIAEQKDMIKELFYAS